MSSRENSVIFALAASGAIFSLIIYTLYTENKDLIIYFQVPAAAALTAALPLYQKFTNRHISPILNRLILFQIILSSFLGSALKFYHLFTFWDKIMHLSFGLLSAALIHYLFLESYQKILGKPLCFLLNLLSTLGAAAIWEMFEFVCDKLFGGDAQRVLTSLQNGKNPIDDTMLDIIVTLPGVIIFCLFRNKRSAKL